MFAFQILTGIKVLKLIQIILISAVKFLFAPLISFSMGFNYIQTMIYTTIGGILGVLFFFFLSKLIMNLYKNYLSAFIKTAIQRFRFRRNNNAPLTQKIKRKFTFRNKSLILLKSKTGMIGIALLTPILLSIPIGTFLASKYYSRKKHILIYLSISVAFWSFVLSTICKLL
jgi:hypothetical protein